MKMTLVAGVFPLQANRILLPFIIGKNSQFADKVEKITEKMTFNLWHYIEISSFDLEVGEEALIKLNTKWIIINV